MKSEIIGKIVAASAVIVGLAQITGRADDLAACAREDYAHAIRPGGVEGSPFWNKYARMFMYPPAFDFSPGGPGTVKYRFTVLDAAGKTHVFDAPSAQSPLTPVWNDIAIGQAWVYVSAIDKDGKVHGIPDWPRDRFLRSFWRSAPFRPGTYPRAPRSYAEAVAKCGDEIFERPATQYFLKTGKPDPDYTHNCYPAKMHAALILGMLDYATRRGDRAADALKLARNVADFLISISQPKGAPLEYWPPTYADKRAAGAFRYGQNMLIYPCGVGTAYLALYERVKDVKYLDAAKRIADTYVKLQEADGTWPIFIRESDGKVLNENRVQPTGVISFLERLYRACGDEKYRACGDRAFAWIEANPLKDWFWEGQFEDAPLCAKYENPSKHPACELALYLLNRYPGDKKWIAVARDILRYAEDQFVCWEKPCAANGHGVNTSIADPSAQLNRYNDWFYPCVLEQYVYYVPVDASNAKLIKTYLALYRAEGKALDLAKARALGDALVRIQRPSGYIPTEYAQVEKREDSMKGWLNCTCFTLSALAELAAFDDVAVGGGLETAKWQAAIDAASAAGGGTVVIPAGDHSTGMLLLKSNVELRLEKGARLVASGQAADFAPPSKAPGAMPRAVVAAVCATNVAVTGEGEIFGNGWAYDYSRNDQPKPMGLCFHKCRKVRLEDFTLRDAASWGINIFQCEDLVARRVKIDCHAGVCTDGFDIEGKNIVIEDCDVDSGDDAYCVKSHDVGYAVENIVVRGCTARSHCNAFKIGTASHGVVRNVSFVNCRAFASRRVYRDLAPMPADLLKWKPVEGAPWYLCGPGFGCINVECVDGGLVENIVADDIKMEGFQTPIFVRGGDRRGFNDGHADVSQGRWFALRNVVISNIRGRADGRTPSTITGAGRCRPCNIVLKDIDLEIPGEGESDKPYSWPGEDKAGAYPQTNMFDAYHLPAYGLFVDKADGVRMENVEFHLRPGTTDARPAVCEK